MPDTVRGQVIFRRAVGDHVRGARPGDPPASAGHPFVFDIALAMIETVPGAYADEQVLDLVVDRRSDGFSMSLSTRGEPIEHPFVDTLPGLLSNMRVKPPFMGALLICGGMALRRTRFPAPEGREVMIGAGIIRSPAAALPEREMFCLTGSAGGRLSMSDPRPVPEAFPIGSAVGQTFSLPIWGFEERRSFHSTLHLDVMDAGMEYGPLALLADPTPEEAERMRDLEASGLVEPFRYSLRDGQYREYRRRLAERGMLPRIDSYPTAAEMEALDAGLGEVVREMLAGDDRDEAVPGMA